MSYVMKVKGLISPSSCNYLMAAIVSLLVLISTMKCCSVSATKTSFIQSCCGSTTYPKLCYSSLSPYASSVGTNRTKLAIVALKVSLKATRNTSALVTKLSRRRGLMANEKAAIKDCVDVVGDAVSQLKQAVAEMSHLGGPNFELEKSNVDTWASAAMTDDETCLDGLDGINGKVEKRIRKSVTASERLTSNALAITGTLTSKAASLQLQFQNPK